MREAVRAGGGDALGDLNPKVARYIAQKSLYKDDVATPASTPPASPSRPPRV